MTTIRQVIQDKNHYWEIHLTEDDIEDEVKKITKRREKNANKDKSITQIQETHQNITQKIKIYFYEMIF